MLRKITSIIPMLLLCNIAVFGQEVQWASKILDFSSQITTYEYGAEQVLGKPNVLPAGGESPHAWVPAKSNRLESIKVGFESPMKIRQVAVAESYNPGTVYQLFLYDEGGNEELINTFDTRPVGSPRMFNITFNETDYEVHAVKIVVDGKVVPGYPAIDAIGISDSEIPIEVELNINEEIGEGLVIEKMGEEINSDYPELRPLISPDKKTMFFSRKFHPENIGGIDDKEDIWISSWDEENNKWGVASNAGEPLNNDGPNFVSSITPDGNSLVLILGNRYKRNDKMRFGVSVSWKDGDGWAAPQPLEIRKFENFSANANFFMANNRRVLFISMERADALGGRDLYVSFLQDDATWSEPANIGDTVNTLTDETGPYLAPDDKTLYFSSAGFSGFGKNDIYVTRRLDDTWLHWSEPENLGSEINSPEDDLFFQMNMETREGYFARGSADGDIDIYQIPVPVDLQSAPFVTISGRVFDKKTGEPVAAKIIYESLEDGSIVGETYANAQTGEYTIMLPPGAKYGYRAEIDGSVALNENIDLTDLAENEILKKNLYVAPIEEGTSIVMRNIFFEFNEANLTTDSYPELNRVVDLLSQYPEITLTIAGHTDNVGDSEYNLALSENRANAVVSYLLEQGVAEERLIAIGYGEAKPMASNEDEKEGRELNRRVEFKISEQPEPATAQLEQDADTAGK